MNILVSIITVNYNGLEDTSALIETIPQTDGVEVIVVDNGSRADEASVLEQRHPWITVVRSAENLGFAGGNNLGIKAAHGKYLYFINNDTLLEVRGEGCEVRDERREVRGESLFQPLIDRLESDPRMGAVCPKIRFSWDNNPIQYAGYTPLSSITLRNQPIGFGEDDHGQHDTPHATPYAHGAAMMVKREAIDKAGLMPECFFLYYEELDWSMMIRRAGYDIWYEPACTIYHKESRTTGQNSPLRTYYITRNRLLFARRNVTAPKRYLTYAYLVLLVMPRDLLKHLFHRQPPLAKAALKGVTDFLRGRQGPLTINHYMWHDWKKTRIGWLLALAVLVAIGIYIAIDARKTDVSGKDVVCIPVYGQSLALGEEAERITDFSQLAEQSHDRIVTENIDNKYGYFDGSSLKQYLKRLFHYRKRSFELSVYGMAESLTQQLGTDTVICTFPGGQGATALAQLSKGTPPYDRFISDIAKACRVARKGQCRSFTVPAVCFMQGESDIADYPDTDYQQLLLRFKDDINRDIKAITQQTDDVRIITYQANALSRGQHFQANSYECVETRVPQTFVHLLLTDTLFWACGPTYPYPAVREVVHIDGASQKQMGCLEALSALAILRHQQRITGLLPTAFEASDSSVTIAFSVPCPPLVFDTVQVSKAPHYGFSVITPDNRDIAAAVIVDSTSVHIRCSESPKGCKVRYAVNGDPMKSGNQHGPRGNLRDSQGRYLQATIAGQCRPLHNWAFQFDHAVSVP